MSTHQYLNQYSKDPTQTTNQIANDTRRKKKTKPNFKQAYSMTAFISLYPFNDKIYRQRYK